MLYAFFDESGMHGGNKTVIAGFVSRASAWSIVQSQWMRLVGKRGFHYARLRGKYGYGVWKDVPAKQRELVIEDCASLLAAPELTVVAGAFSGDWNWAMAQGPDDWKARFPHAYQYCFEACMEQLERLSVEKWDGEPIAVMMSEHNEQATRALEIWKTYRGNGFWPHVASLSYNSPKLVPALQAADMIVYETYKNLGSNSIIEWSEWPLCRRLIERGADMQGMVCTAEKLVAIMKKADDEGRQYLRRV